MLNRFTRWINLSVRDLLMIVSGNTIMAFALVNIHIPAEITEGGGIGLSILLSKSLSISPAVSPLFIDAALYALGVVILGRGFLRKACFATLTYTSVYALMLKIGPVLPALSEHPGPAAVLGGLLIGLGCALVVTRGGAAGSDDCYALIVSEFTPLSLGGAYFMSDFVILMLSGLLYLPMENVLWSLLTTLISSFTLGQFELHLPEPQPVRRASNMHA